MSETEYVCKRCGEPWETEITPFYIEGKCSSCGAPKLVNKVVKDGENPLLRDGE